MRHQKSKLRANGKCLSCIHWGYSKRIEAIIKETWGDDSPKIPEEFSCRSKNWRKECSHADL